MTDNGGPDRTLTEDLGASDSGAPEPSAGAAPPPRSGEVDRSGETLGPFRLIAKLGEGGMGVVYAAEDVRLGRTVALKILPREAVQREDRRRRFLREARAASAVMHPGIAAIFEVGEHAGEVFLAMERAPGRTLRAELRAREAPFEVDRALGVIRMLAEGLCAAHAVAIVHRDLKPENVMVGPDGRLKILDFGLAKRVGGGDAAPPPAAPGEVATTEGQILGTPGYMSPEQALGEPVDTRTDLFALGVILYELLTLARPFRGETRAAVLVATYRDPAGPPSALNTAVPVAVDRLVSRCLEKGREERFQSAEELIAAIDAACGRAGGVGPGAGAAGVRPAFGGAARAGSGPVLIGAGLLALGVAALLAWRGGGGAADGAAGTALSGGAASSAASASEAASAMGDGAPAVGSGASPGPSAPVRAGGWSLWKVARRPCLAGEPGAAECAAPETVAWCDPEGRALGCCGEGLVPKSEDGICACAPGGTAVAKALSRGCAPVPPDWQSEQARAKQGAVARAIACFEPEKRRGTVAGGVFAADFYLTPEGGVFGARVERSTLPDDQAQACALEALRSTPFPAPPGEEAGKKLGFGFQFKD